MYVVMTRHLTVCIYETTAMSDGTPASAPASASTSTTDDLDGLEQMRKQKQFKLVIETGKQKFNIAPRKVIRNITSQVCYSQIVRELST